MAEKISEQRDNSNPRSKRAVFSHSCPFCGGYCNISGSFERVHYFLVRVNEDETEELLDSYIPPGDEDIDEGPDNIMRTRSVLQLRTKARFPWRLTNRDEDPIAGPEFIT